MAADPTKCFQYNFALVSRVANSFATESSYEIARGQTIDIDRARQEHETLVDALRRIGVDVVELPCDDKHPDGLFVDDIAVVVNGTALICNPPSIKDRPSRQGEVRGRTTSFHIH
jgi:dimethylargininase